MSQCSNCGAELDEEAKFCMECGTPVPQNKKCVQCCIDLPLKAKFCFSCGAPQNGEKPTPAMVNMGDKNVIAGDVIGQKIAGDNVGNKILGNATFTTIQDDTKRVNTCAICGKHMTNDEGHSCPSCGKVVCEDHFDNKKNICQDCVNEIIKKYKETLYETWGNSKIKLSEKTKLEQLRMDAGLSSSDVVEIEKNYFFCNRIVVADNGSGDFTSIKEALEYADDGITIFIKLGLYYENVVIIEKSVQIIGEQNGSNIPFFDGSFLIQDVNANPTITNCIISGEIHILAGAQGIIEKCNLEECDIHIQDYNTNPTIRDSKIHFDSHINISTGAQGVVVNCDISSSGINIGGTNTNPTIKECRILDEYISINDGGQGSIENCDITSEINIRDANTNPTIKGCRIHDGKKKGLWWRTGVGINILTGARGTIENCDIFGNEYPGIVIQDANTNPTVKDSKIHDGKQNGILIKAGAQGTVENCDVFGNGFPGICIQDANTNPIVKGSKIHDGKQNGILIKAGAQGTIENCDIFGNEYPGIDIQDANTNPTVKECKIHDGKQNGIWINAGAQGTIENCDIFGNENPGIAIQDKNTNPTVKKCRIYEGKSNGLIVLNGANGTIEHCDFFKNNDPAFVIENTNTNPTITSCKFHDNASSGIYALDEAAGNIKNCSFTKNEYPIYIKGIKTHPSIKNCTYLDNAHCCMSEVIKITAPPQESCLDRLYVKNLVKEGDWVLLSQKVAEIQVIPFSEWFDPKSLSLSSPCYGIVELVHHLNGEQVHGGDTLISIREIW